MISQDCCRSAVGRKLLAKDDASSHVQVGGHHDVMRFEGAVARKKLLKGDGEARNLEILARHPLLRTFVPAFIRIDRRCAASTEITASTLGDDGHDWLVMENVCAGFALAACMDLKIGTRTYGDSANAEKAARLRRNTVGTTTESHGVRLVGARLPPSTEGGAVDFLGYALTGRDHARNGAELGSVVARFLRTPPLRRAALARVSELCAWFKTQREYAFFGSSLLLCYDSTRGADAELRVAMIDFAHVRHCRGENESGGDVSAAAAMAAEVDMDTDAEAKGAGLDESFLFGLRSLRRILEGLAAEEEAAGRGEVKAEGSAAKRRCVAEQ